MGDHQATGDHAELDDALTRPVAALIDDFRHRRVSPVEVARRALERIDRLDPVLHAFVVVDPPLTLSQARSAEAAYRDGDAGPLAGVPISVKDLFHVAGWPTGCGSLTAPGDPAAGDSGVARRLRRAGAVFTGKTNTSEFGMSATSDNRLGADTANPWDVTRTPGGSSGGAAASVAAGMSSIAVGSDGGGSVRIPAAFCGLFGIKPTYGLCPDEGGVRAMQQFSCPGPIAWRAADARLVLSVLGDRDLRRRPTERSRIGVCRRPEDRPVEPAVLDAVDATVAALAELGHDIDEVELPVDGWIDVFGPLVVAEEGAERGDLLADPELLTDYERRTLLAARALEPGAVDRARSGLERLRSSMLDLFQRVDVVVTPTTAVPAFELGRRPRSIAGQPVDTLWGPFPFTAPFNLLGGPATSLPCGLAGGLPVGVQLAAAPHRDGMLLDLAESLEEHLALDLRPVAERFGSNHEPSDLPSAGPGR